MMMFERQIKGIIAVSVILAFIPFISFFTTTQMHSKDPVLSTSNSKFLIIEVVQENEESGIFFVEPGTSISQILSRLGMKRTGMEDIKLQNGMKVRLISEANRPGMVIEKMEAAKRLALGLPLDINLVDEDELTLIPGIGETLAVNIVTQRKRIGRFENIDQLMDIKGIKEKKLSTLRRYLYVDQL